MQCHDCKKELYEVDFTVRINHFPARLKQFEGRYVLVEFDCPHCGRNGVSYAGINGFVPRKHFQPAEVIA